MKSNKSSSESGGSEPNSTSRGSELTAPSVGNVSGPEGVSVDKIRDLLFGNQMQDYDRRFSNLEERFLQQFKEIESETSQSCGRSDRSLRRPRPATTSFPRRYGKHHWALRLHGNLEVEIIVAAHAYHLPALILAARRAISYAGTIETLCLDEIAQSNPCLR